MRRITGAKGQRTIRINGFYECTEDVSGGMPVYRKLDDYDVHLLYSPASKMWIIQAALDRGTNLKWAYLRCDPPCLPEKALQGSWQIDEGVVFRLQEEVLVSFPTRQEVAVAERLAASVRADGRKVFVSKF